MFIYISTLTLIGFAVLYMVHFMRHGRIGTKDYLLLVLLLVGGCSIVLYHPPPPPPTHLTYLT